jgi:hypothetical protein
VNKVTVHVERYSRSRTTNKESEKEIKPTRAAEQIRRLFVLWVGIVMHFRNARLLTRRAIYSTARE